MNNGDPSDCLAFAVEADPNSGPVVIEAIRKIKAKPGVKGRQATEDEMIEFCKQHLARYKAPKSVEFVEILPKNPQGKILKRELRKKYWEG